MKNRLWLKFLVLLLIVGGVALSGTFVLRYLMLADFSSYLEGETEDRIYGILAGLEAAYADQSEWSADRQAKDALRAFAMGFQIRLSDEKGTLVVDSARVLETAPPFVAARLKALSKLKSAGNRPFIPYPLFLGGQQIGTLEIRELRPTRDDIFIRRSDIFLFWCIAAVGGLAVALSLFFSRRLTRPIKDLALAASEISRGNLEKQVQTSRQDEIGDLAQTFNRMARSIRSQEALRRRLVADVAHELRTPLGVMRAEIEGLIDGYIPNDPVHLQSLHEETGRLKHLVEAIEELNQAEASGLTLQVQHIRLRPFLDNIMQRFRPFLEEKKVLLQVDCTDEVEIIADPDRLSQIIINLMSNALKAVEDHGEISVSVGREKDKLIIAIKDNGCGIAEEDLPYVFERFYRGRGGGLGIGLTIVKELVDAHGGRIELESEYGKGARFTLFFPVRSVHNSS